MSHRRRREDDGDKSDDNTKEVIILFKLFHPEQLHPWATLSLSRPITLKSELLLLFSPRYIFQPQVPDRKPSKRHPCKHNLSVSFQPATHQPHSYPNPKLCPSQPHKQNRTEKKKKKERKANIVATRLLQLLTRNHQLALLKKTTKLPLFSAVH